MVARAALYLLCLPSDLPGFFRVLIYRALWGRELQWRHGVLYCELRAGTRGERWLDAAARTYGHSILFGPGWSISEVAWRHELAHVEQTEAAAVMGALVTGAAFAALVPWWLAVLPAILWSSVQYGTAGVTAVLRGERYYTGNHLEKSAYAQEPVDATRPA